MKTVKYGDFTISADTEKTAEYYRNYIVPKTQANRNFSKYCENLTDEEKDFFNAFAIDPVCCEIEHSGVSKKGDFPCGGYYLVCGEYLEFPPENLITVEQLAENGFEDDRPDPRIDVGAFQFDFQCAEYEFSDIPDDIPEGFICIRFWCENMKWLLDEEPETRMYEPPRFWEIGKIIKERKEMRRQRKVDIEDAEQEYCRVFDGMGIPFRPLDKKETEKYPEVWVKAYAPPEKNIREIMRLCASSDKYTPFLWHMFSYEFLPCMEAGEAENAFSLAKGGSCVLFDNVERLAYHLESSAAVTPELIGSFMDVTVTADDFSWTYSKTHEENIGPYFYKK